ncbi:MAG: hypothetical protein Q8K60_02725 [Parachlamydiaceae bacterium]|nr:hypothetical protein [Parachlamydiaceae bacterium]
MESLSNLIPNTNPSIQESPNQNNNVLINVPISILDEYKAFPLNEKPLIKTNAQLLNDQFKEVKNFITFLYFHFKNDYQPNLKQLFNLCEKNKIKLTFITIAKLSPMELKIEVINFLKTLTKDECLILKKSIPETFKFNFLCDVFYLSNIYKKIDKIKKYDEISQKHDAFKDLFQSLIIRNYFGLAFKLARENLVKELRDIFFSDNSIQLVKFYFNEALEVAYAINDPSLRNNTLKNLSKILILLDSEKAINIIERSIIEPSVKISAFVEIYFLLFEKEHFILGSEIIKGIKNKHQQSKVLYQIIYDFAHPKNAQESIEYALLNPQEFLKEKQLKEALDTVDKISNEGKRIQALKEIFNNLIDVVD